jgi:SAM-dependent methyltransferase
MTTATVDLDAVKSRQQLAWADGDYAVIGTTLQVTGELLCEAVDVSAGERVLDVAGGNGNASLAAARRGGDVTATDYVGELLDRTGARAAAEGLSIERREADAEALPFEDGSFDVVLSAFGVMFTPNQQRAAQEIRRVCRPGGRIGLTNWTPSGFVGQMFKIVGRYAPPPAGLRSPLEWGTNPRLSELFAGVRTLLVEERYFLFRYRSAAHWVETFRTFYGPMVKAFASLDGSGRAALAEELLHHAESNNIATDGTLKVPSEYFEVVAVEGS